MTDTPPPSSDSPAAIDGDLPYAEAVSELEAILQRIEDADIDVDELSAAVERAAALLKLCRSRIQKAETRVVQILDDIDSMDGPDRQHGA